MAREAFLRIEKLTKGRVEGYEQWQEIPLDTDAVLIGRPSKERDAIPLDIKIIGDDYISRTPIEVSYSQSDDSYMLRDYGTRNGTFLNGDLIEADGRGYPLKDCDLIAMVKVQGEPRVILRFRLSYGTQPVAIGDGVRKPSTTKGLAVNSASRRVYVDGQEIPLTKTEWNVFDFLYSNRGKVCSIDDITWEVWGPDGAAPELVTKYIQRLRDKIEPDRSNPRYIKRHSTGGYILES